VPPTGDRSQGNSTETAAPTVVIKLSESYEDITVAVTFSETVHTSDDPAVTKVKSVEEATPSTLSSLFVIPTSILHLAS